ncbi:DUF2198 family protein [Lederbergia graminis]|uniref:DUF2198 family protein n=1 Tax=Lederbergia graminis TaxID=735518 RepID=A0ABW0LLE2_9BACI|nr:DUF2198 family protein [Paenibacillus bovis]HLU23011.1 DUF2198 family protein [Bacillaceae bacterium]
MIDKLISAIFLPAIIMVFFTRVTYNRVVAFILTVALIIVSAHRGYIDTWWLIVIEAGSLTIGLYIANEMKKKKQKK